MAGRKGTNVAPITAEEVEKLSNFGATMPDMAAWFRCSLSWIEQKLAKNPELAAAREYGLGNLRCSLRQRQVKIAMDDHHPKQGLMLIWLGKQLLGQKDQVFNVVEGTLDTSASPRELLETRIASIIERSRAEESPRPTNGLPN